VFGWRKDDEDPFAALKQGGTYQSAPTTAADIGFSDQPASVGSAVPVVTAPPPAPTTPQAPVSPSPGVPPSLGAPPKLRRMRGSGSGLPVVRLLVVAGVIAAIVIPVATSVKHAVNSIKVPTFNFGQTSTTQSFSDHGAGEANYLQVANVRAALARVRRLVPGARVNLLRVDATSFNVNAVGRGVAKEIYFGPSGTLVASGVSAGQNGVPIAQVRPSAIARIISGMRQRFHIPASRIDYIVLSSPAGLPPTWIAFSKNAGHTGYRASLSGGGLKRLGT
jgi:hypothetical protein